jgi:hypothetical protein
MAVYMLTGNGPPNVILWDGSSSYTPPSGMILAVYNASTFAAAVTTWNNSLTLSQWQAIWQSNLDIFLDQFMNLNAFIRAGTLTNVTGTQVGNFLATICNNYRTLRASIAAAATPAAVQAININSGWPANP